MNRSINWWFVGVIALLIASIYFLKPILTPFFTAALLAYLTDPLVKRMVQIKIPRTLAVVIVFIFLFLIITALLLLLVPMLERQILLLISKIPEFLSWVQQIALPWLSDRTGIQEVMNFTNIKGLLTTHWQQAGNIATEVVKTITRSGYSLFVFLLNLVLIPVVMFYFLRDWDGFTTGIHRLIPRGIEPVIMKLVDECNEVIGAFFRGQFLVMLCLGVYYALGLTISGLELGLLIGFIIGLVSIVPYLGFIIGITVAALAGYTQYHDWEHLTYIAIVFAIGHVLESYILAPNLVGDRIGLHPVAVIFSILAGGTLFGFTGVLLALPVAAVIMVMIRATISYYLQSNWYSAIKPEKQ